MFKQINQNSFFGNFLYERIISRDHFLRRLDETVDFSFINDLCKDCYPNLDKPGNRPYEPVMLFKQLFLSFLYNISDREIEEQTNLNMAFKWFVGLPADGFAPDHSTLTYFRDRLGTKRFEEIFNQIVKQSREKGLIDDRLKIIDSTHVQAKVDINRLTKEFKEKNENDSPDDLKGSGVNKTNYVDKSSPDPDARFGRKSNAKKFYGYKKHIIIDGDSEIIEQVKVTPGNVADEKMLEPLIKDMPRPKDLRKKPKMIGDKGYDSNRNHEVVEEHDYKSFIILKNNRKASKFKQRMKSAIYKKVTKQRYKVERIFAHGKNNHGLSKCRWLGQFKFEIQAYLTSIVLNCKRIVVLSS